MKYLIGFLFYLLAIIGSLFFPDVDQYLHIPRIIAYRSALTYSILLPLLWYYIAGKEDVVKRFVGLGLFLGISIRLSFELYPVLIAGGENIFFPAAGQFSFLPAELASLGSLLVSGVWLVSNIYFGMKYYFKLSTGKRWFRILSVVFIPLTFYGYMVYSGRYWMVSLVALILLIGLIFKRNRNVIPKLA
jgi:hypothetical protein